MRTKTLVVSTVLAFYSCSEQAEPKAGSEAGEAGEKGCVSDLEFFQREVSGPILERKCLGCHTAQGAARTSKLVLLPPGQTDALRLNFETLKEVASYERDATSILLLKPTAQITHGGGPQVEKDSAEDAALAALVERFRAPATCTDNGETGVLSKVKVLDLPATLRRAKLQLAFELPTSAELTTVSEGGEAAFDGLVAGYMERAPFYDSLKTWFNDLLLTNKYLGGDNATNLLNADTYPQRHYYRDLPEDTDEGRLARRHANDSVAREPLELIAHVVAENRPFSEVLTATYLLVNPFSARVYGVKDVTFDDATDPNEWREGHVVGIPHAGILTSPMFLNRYPTTDTNVNRHRSRIVHKLFLASDVLRLAERPLDPTSIKEHNPTQNSEQCSVCHAVVDPVAGAFMNWDDRGNYDPRDAGWLDSMVPPGYGQSDIPAEDWPRATRWLANAITKDRLFAVSAVYALYQGLIGRAPMDTPTDQEAPGYRARLEYQLLEKAFLDSATDAFVAANLNLKVIVPLIVRSPFYRAYAVEGPLDEADRAILAPLGTMTLLTPEQLDQKLKATFGRSWQRSAGEANELLHRDRYLYFYGGIDSDNVTRRITEPNGIMANIGLRMANEMACLVVAQDMRKPIEERVLFPHVEYGYAPEDVNGFDVPEVIDAIKKNIRYLHFRILGELLPAGDAELERTYQLFLETWRELYAAGKNQQIRDDLHGLCQATRDPLTGIDYPEDTRLTRDTRFTLRTWMAVVAYLMSDWRFLYQQ